MEILLVISSRRFRILSEGESESEYEGCVYSSSVMIWFVNCQLLMMTGM